MFAPQTDTVCPTARCIEIPARGFFCILIQGLDCPLPHPLFPVYRFFFPVASILQTLVLGFMSPSSRVGQ